MNENQQIEMRKIVPVCSMIGSGKSKLLNVLFNIDFLEVNGENGTKFVNLLRYNPTLKQPKFFHLKLIKKNDEFLFYKDLSKKEIIGNNDIKKEIKSTNEYITAHQDIKLNELFYMTEINDAPFIEDKLYLLNHDLCDMPGFKSYISDDNKEKIQTKNEDKEDKIDKETLKELGFEIISNEDIEENKCHDNENEENEELINKDDNYVYKIFDILCPYIEDGIFILSIENYYFVENYKIIEKIREIYDNEIKNFLIILNKIDLSTNKIDDIKKCKALLLQKFNQTNVFNLNLNTFVPVSIFQLENELLMSGSFRHLINYHFINYLFYVKKESHKDNTILDKTLIDYLKELILKFEKVNNKEIEQKVNKLNESEDILQINEELKNIIENLNKFSIEDNVNLGIIPDEIDNDNEEIYTDDINAVNILKMMYIFFKEKKLIPPISEESTTLLSYFTKKEVQRRGSIRESIDLNFKLSNEIIYFFKTFCEEIEKSKIETENFKFLTTKLRIILECLKSLNAIFVPFIGESNSGKTTILNGIIGKEILPSDLNECTKTGIIIKYNNHEKIKIRKTKFIEEKTRDKNYYHFEEGDVIGEGIEQVRDTLNCLNYCYSDNEDYFYCVETKIKLFDDMGLENSLKKIIYLIDFPGFGTGNKFEKNNIYNKIMSICNFFVFVVKNTEIKNQQTYNFLSSLFEKAKQEKKQLITAPFTKSCLFVLNNRIEQSTEEKDLILAKKDIQILLNGIDFNEINACFFNAKFYLNFINFLNYFSSVKSLFEEEKKNFIRKKQNIFNSENKENLSIDISFFNYLLSKISSRVQKEFQITKAPKTQKINKHIEEEYNKIYIELSKSNMNLNDSNNKNKLLKLISYARENISNLKTLKSSNIEEFSKSIRLQIQKSNDTIKEITKKKLKEIIDLLDMYFRRDFSERKNELVENKEFIIKLNEILKKLKELLDLNREINPLVEGYKKAIIRTLKNTKKNLKETLKKDNYNLILQNIKNELIQLFSCLVNCLIEKLNYIEVESQKFYDEAKEIIEKFCNNKILHLKSIKSLKNVIISNFTNDQNDLKFELNKELKNTCNCLDANNTDFKQWLLSVFSDSSYISSIIDKLIISIPDKLDYISKIINEQYNKYLEDIINSINSSKHACLMKFDEDQLKKWKQLLLRYNTTKKNIEKFGFFDQ